MDLPIYRGYPDLIGNLLILHPTDVASTRQAVRRTGTGPFES
jgi:hypothetical protein